MGLSYTLTVAIYFFKFVGIILFFVFLFVCIAHVFTQRQHSQSKLLACPYNTTPTAERKEYCSITLCLWQIPPRWKTTTSWTDLRAFWITIRFLENAEKLSTLSTVIIISQGAMVLVIHRRRKGYAKRLVNTLLIRVARS